MTEENYNQNTLVAENLHLPTKQQEIDLFNNYDLVSVFDKYLPLADYILDEYACPTDEISMHAEETAYTTLMNTIILFRRKKMYEKPTLLSQFVTELIRSFIDEYEKDGMLYKVSKTFAVK